MRTLSRSLPCAWVAALALTASACGKTAGEHLAEGNHYIERGQYAEAIAALRSATQLDPDSGEARFRLGEAYLRARDYEHAAIEFVNAGALMPQNLEAQLRAGEMILLAGRFPEAQSIARRALLLDPKNIRALILNANALAGMKRHEQAMAAIERAIQLDPTRADVTGDLGMLQLRSGSPAQAEQTFKRMIELDPKSVDGYITLGSFYWVQGRRADAESALLSAFKLEPTNISANRALATFYLGTNRTVQAEQHLRVAVEGTATTGAELALADYYLSLGRDADAERVLERTVKRDGGFGEARSRLAVIRYRVNRDAGHALIDDTLAKDASSARALLTKAGFLIAEGDTAAALERATAAVNADLKSLPGRYMLGQIHSQIGNLDAAARQYEEILQIQPSSVAARMELAMLQMARGQRQAAVTAAQDAVRSRPESIDARALLLRSLIASGDVERATELLNPLLKDAGDRADVRWMAGMLELRKRNRQAARGHFEHALRHQPDALEPLDGLTALDLADGRAAAARQRVEAQLGRQPRSIGLLVLAARVQAATKDYPAAERSLKTAIDVDANAYAAFEELARVYALQRALDRGIRELEEMGRRFPRSAGPPITLGSIMELRSRPFEAQAWFDKALAIEPRNPIAANNLAWLHADQGGDLDQALRLALLAHQQLSQRPDVADTLGWVYYKRGEVSLALPLLRQAAEQEPDNPVFHYHLGLAYAKLGQPTRAREALNRALARNVDFQGIANARSVLTSLQ